jgi:hypothetical protein
MSEKTRYSDAELEEFRQIILDKLEKAKRDYDQLKSALPIPAVTIPKIPLDIQSPGGRGYDSFQGEAGRLAQRQSKLLNICRRQLIAD